MEHNCAAIGVFPVCRPSQIHFESLIIVDPITKTVDVPTLVKVALDCRLVPLWELSMLQPLLGHVAAGGDPAEGGPALGTSA